MQSTAVYYINDIMLHVVRLGKFLESFHFWSLIIPARY